MDAASHSISRRSQQRSISEILHISMLKGSCAVGGCFMVVFIVHLLQCKIEYQDELRLFMGTVSICIYIYMYGALVSGPVDASQKQLDGKPKL